MSYIAFARKWRPQKFDEVVGQEHITTTLKNAIDMDRIAHAYIFTGPKGIGKTSTARILAKALNCVKGPASTPCNKCVTCKEITTGNSMDVLEIDGASNRGIDEIRNLRENIKFMPGSGKFKIYIIDEVHMLTQEAFNALLKTLEEPPKHVKFIFATTMPQKVLPTILSRCQRFDFKMISEAKIVEKLSSIAREEKINIEEEALFTIAKVADSSLRDAESILDQLVNLYREKISSDDVTKLLGIATQNMIFDFVNNVRDHDTAKVIKLINNLANEGKDISKFTIDLCEHLRDMLIVKIDANNQDLLSLPQKYKKKVNKQAKDFSQAELFYMINILLNTYSKMRYISIPKIPLEIAAVKLTQRDKIIELDNILNKFDELRKTISSNSTSYKNISSVDKNPSYQSQDNPADKIKDSKTLRKREEESFNDEVFFELSKFKEIWPEIINKVKTKRMSLGTYLNEAKLIDIKNNKIILGFYPELKFHMEVLEERKNKKYIEDILKQNFKHDFIIKFKKIAKSKKKIKEENVEEKSVLNNEIIKSAIEIFNGKIVFNGKMDTESENR